MQYDDTFFDYVDEGARRSAEVLVGVVHPVLQPASVLDVGCGRGGWLSAWKAAGATVIFGVDGDYVDRTRLLIPPSDFAAVDLTTPLDLARRFDLVQSLEVGEHLPAVASATLVDSIVRHGDVVLFSAAVPGQGGTRHINEKPLEYWRDLFAARGYAAFDALRPAIHDNARVEPWYRYNTIVYANDAGQQRLGAAYLATRVPPSAVFADLAPLPWRVRRAVLRHLPVAVVDQAARVNAQLHRLRRRSA